MFSSVLGAKCYTLNELVFLMVAATVVDDVLDALPTANLSAPLLNDNDELNTLSVLVLFTDPLALRVAALLALLAILNAALLDFAIGSVDVEFFVIANVKLGKVLYRCEISERIGVVWSALNDLIGCRSGISKYCIEEDNGEESSEDDRLHYGRCRCANL